MLHPAGLLHLLLQNHTTMFAILVKALRLTHGSFNQSGKLRYSTTTGTLPFAPSNITYAFCSPKDALFRSFSCIFCPISGSRTLNIRPKGGLRQGNRLNHFLLNSSAVHSGHNAQIRYNTLWYFALDHVIAWKQLYRPVWECVRVARARVWRSWF